MNPFLYYRVCSLLSRIMIILLISIKSSFLLSPSLVSFSLILLYSWKKFCVKTACKIGIGCTALIVNGRLKHVNGRDYLCLLSDKQRNLIVLCRTTVTGHFWPFFLSLFVFFCLHIWLPLQLLQETETSVCRDLWVPRGKSLKSSLGNINMVGTFLFAERLFQVINFRFSRVQGRRMRKDGWDLGKNHFWGFLSRSGAVASWWYPLFQRWIFFTICWLSGEPEVTSSEFIWTLR